MQVSKGSAKTTSKGEIGYKYLSNQRLCFVLPIRDAFSCESLLRFDATIAPRVSTILRHIPNRPTDREVLHRNILIYRSKLLKKGAIRLTLNLECSPIRGVFTKSGSYLSRIAPNGILKRVAERVRLRWSVVGAVGKVPSLANSGESFSY